MMSKMQASISALVLAMLLPFICNMVVKGEPLFISAATAPAQIQATPIDTVEASALLSLRGLLGIRSQYWPRKLDPCQVWAGIDCQDGHVVNIALSGLRRTSTGAQHPSFALDPLRNLSNLRIFNSSGFALPGEIPDWFGSLSTLQHLDFTSSSISFSIPSSLGNLFNLQTLAMANNNLTGTIPSSLGNLTSLTSLDLSFNHLTGTIPEALINLQNLTTLNLGSNQLVGQIPPGIGNLIKLQFLLLGNNAFQGPIPSELGNLSSLSNLDGGANALSGPIPISLGRLASLVSLRLSNNSLNGSVPGELSNCTHLQTLTLDRNAFTGSLPDSLGSLTNLSTLGLSSNNLTGFLPTRLAALSQAQQILLSNNLFYGTIPSGFANLTKITTLDLSKNYFEGSVPVFASRALLDGNCLTSEPNQRSAETCNRFYLSKGLSFQGIIEAPSPSMPIAVNIAVKRTNHVAPILGGVFGGLGFVFLVMVAMFYVLKRQKHARIEQGDILPTVRKGVPTPFSGNISVNLLCLGENFSYTQLQQATGDFNEVNLLKAGHSGDIYQGLLEGHIPIVVKKVNLTRFKKDSYLSELDIFGKASHTRLVPLLGHCLEREQEKLLVYKYMPGRDLGYALQKRSKGNPLEDSLQSLDWITRLKIAIGAAEGLTHLHQECTPALVHRDIQSSSIFLDDKFEVRLGSLAEACVAVGEPHQGVIARILRRSQTSEQQGEAGAVAPTCAYDVYCFGKVLLELVSGKLGISSSTDPSTDAWLEWALAFINVHDKESISKIVDPNLIVDEDLMDEVWAMSIVAKSCLNPKPSKRPLMRYILKALENPLKVVREDTLGSGRSRTSSYGSWNGALFGSWRHSSSETVAIPGSLREEYLHKNKHAMNGGSHGSGGHVEVSLSQRRPGSSEIFPEPLEDTLDQVPTNKDSDKPSN